MYRILEDNQSTRERRNQLRHPDYQKPELLATGPNEVWSWDITKLKGPEKYDERQRLIWEAAYKMFDFREMAKSSLGKNWNNITAEERDRFVKLFSSLVKKRYIGKINDYTDQEIVYTKQLIKKDRAMVYSLIIDKGTEIPIIYKLKADQEKWFIYDMKIENVSMVLNYRRDFDSVIRKEKFAGLLERITEQLEKKQDSP